nr:Dihydrofolate reductase [uncultured bacterium]AIA16461.1 Dihydrofolate reductase [uncultured bacterium]
MIILGPVAVSENNVIGKNNDLPWHLPEDLKHFKELTLGKTVLMGRKTFESIVSRLGKPLPGRKNVVITRQEEYKAPAEVLVFKSLDEAVQNLLADDVYIIGGAEIFKQALPVAQAMEFTHVHGNFEGDAFFPSVNWDEWEKVKEEKHEKFSFAKYIKRT